MTAVAEAAAPASVRSATAAEGAPAATQDGRVGSFVVYGDFTDALSYLASRCLDRARGTGIDVEWRAVVGHPSLTVTRHAWPQAQRPSRLLQGPWRHLTRREVEGVVEPVYAVRPQPSVSAYAEAVGAGVGDAVRHLLFDAYWSHGTDIGNPDVLRRLLTVPILHGTSTSSPVDLYGYVVAPSGSPVTTGAWRRIRTWQREWDALSRAQLPVVLNGSSMASGRDALEYLAEATPEPGATSTDDDPYPLPPLRGDKHRVDLAVPHGVTPWWEA